MEKVTWEVKDNWIRFGSIVRGVSTPQDLVWFLDKEMIKKEIKSEEDYNEWSSEDAFFGAILKHPFLSEFQNKGE